MISQSLKNYIKIAFDTSKEINTLEDFENFTDEYGSSCVILQKICSASLSSNNFFNYIQLIDDCLAIGADINGYKEPNAPVIFTALTYRPDLAIHLFKNGAYNDRLKKYCKEHPKENMVIELTSHYTDKKLNPYKIKLLDYLESIGEVDLNIVNNKGLNLLQSTYSVEVAQWLLSKGMDPYQKNKKGTNAFSHHQNLPNQIHQDILQVLHQHVTKKECKKILTVINKKRNKSTCSKQEDAQQLAVTKAKSKKLL